MPYKGASKLMVILIPDIQELLHNKLILIQVIIDTVLGVVGFT